ncbi:hypothetical protein H920_12769 [Fukomys damarensis]|uniref:Uncharacterized protein n=1 Tax=Fukomys damarensis TaxID=885580 RepID=A0A091DST2_FUKDA|nr:hypothetical protein H920_12769 [Fukomys damarensis]
MGGVRSCLGTTCGPVLILVTLVGLEKNCFLHHSILASGPYTVPSCGAALFVSQVAGDSTAEEGMKPCTEASGRKGVFSRIMEDSEGYMGGKGISRKWNESDHLDKRRSVLTRKKKRWSQGNKRNKKRGQRTHDPCRVDQHTMNPIVKTTGSSAQSTAVSPG